MRVLIACEFSGVVRSAFRKLGHDAWSCDIRPAADGSDFHLYSDVRKVLDQSWDLMIAHPPCTHLASSGARHFAEKVKDGRQQKALEFVLLLLNAPIPKIALENPVGIISSRIRPPDQYIEPFQFGHPERKKTGLWLKNLPLLRPIKIVQPLPGSRIADRGPSQRYLDERSVTYKGIAIAMALQWGGRVKKRAE